MVLAFMLAAFAMPSGAAGQDRFLEDIRVEYDVSVRCSGVFGAAATGKSMEHFDRHPDVGIYRRHETQFLRYAQRFGPQLRIPDAVTEEAISDVRGEAFRPTREALFAQDVSGFHAGLRELYALTADCEDQRVRLSRAFGIPPDLD
ncbi:MAG: hypothetical protein M3Q74_07980 [Pseudomonadota bacterium]|nr:hypothetical protein [Pseudomonadota bacterium]